MKRSILTLITAGQHLAAQRIEAAARGEGSKLDAFLGSMALEAAKTLLELGVGEELGLELELELEHELIPERFVELTFSAPTPSHFTTYPDRSEHGPN